MPDSTREEIAKLEALYANNPAGRVFTHLAEAYRKAGELDRARGILDEGLQKHPGYASAYVVLGRVLLDLQEPEPAGDAFRRVLELDPHNLVALRSLGDLARAAGRTDEALRYFDELRQQDPGNDEIERITNELRTGEADVRAETGEWSPATTETESSEPAYEPEAAAPAEPASETGEEAPWEGGWRPYGDVSRTVEFHAAETSYEEYQEVVPEAGQAADADAPAPEEDFQLGWLEGREPAAEETTSDIGEITSLSAAAQVPEWENEGPSDELGDLSSIGAAAQQFEVEGETFAAEDLDFGVTQPPEVEGPVGEETEVLTETIAELYRKQGFYDRAADVYRSLLSDRPGDPDLEARLAEVEALNRPVMAAHAEEEAESVASEADEPDSENAAPWLSGGSAVAEGPPTPYAWAEQVPEPGAEPGQPIRVYFARLLAWQPQQASRSAAGATTAAEAFDEWFGASEPAPIEATPNPAQAPPSAAEASSPSQPSGAGDDDDDDDLEMFRSWLQSLKK